MLISNLTYTKAMDEFINIVDNSVYTHICDPKITSFFSKEPLPFSEKEKGDKSTLKVGDIWGSRYDCSWFHIEATIPKDTDLNNLYLIIDMSGEGCVFTNEGVPFRGLTTRCALYEQWIGMHHKKVCELKPFVKNGNLSMWIDCGANDMLGSCYDNGILREAWIGSKSEVFYELKYDIDTLFDLTKQLDINDPRRAQIEHALYEASKCVPTGANIRSGVNYIGSPDITKEIKQGTDSQAKKALKILKPMLNKKAGDTAITHHMVGHSHIDLAWLWPIRETKRKCQRTFATVLRNLEKYPEYKFVQSQAQAYKWIKEEHPKLFSQIKEKVKEGRWEVNGGMWVEADGNLASGESFVRQFLYGKRFFKKEFDEDCKVCHLPDTFGYNGALPQIIKESEMDYFLFQKLMVNIYNKFPYNSFKWRGIDGTEILCHMPPCNTYQSNALPECNLRAERNYAEKAVSEHVLSLYGIGDGGSGPGEEHLERIKRQKNLQGVGKNIMSSSIDFFKCLEKEKDNFFTQIGEMYLEFHQGTLTTQAHNKKANRNMERDLRNLEILSVYAKVYGGKPYPKEKIEKIWKEVLLYQFHDILPGSSIKRVYDESREGYQKLSKEIEKLTLEALNALPKYHSLFNTLPFERNDFIKTEKGWCKVSVPALGSTTTFTETKEKAKTGKNFIENDLIKVTFGKNGEVNIYDKEANRNVLKNGAKLIVFQDTTDAWDMYADYFERDAEVPKLSQINIVKDGPVAFALLTFNYNNSEILQKISISYGSKLVTFNTNAVWNEAGKMLRAYMEPDIITDYSRSEIQFGNIKRSTKDFTSHDMAKYEICAHKWIDMSERDYGVALLNDCKYGHFAKEQVLSLNLLRSTSYPDENADMGAHSFKYAIFPHTGDYVDGKVIENAYIFNHPLIEPNVAESCHMLRPDYQTSLPIGESPIKPNTKEIINNDVIIPIVSSNDLIIETIKEAEDSENIIVRLYEGKEKRGTAEVSFGIPVKKVYLTNILEHIKEELPVKDNKITLPLSPFKIYTLMIEL